MPQAKGGSRGSPPGNNKQLEIFFSIFNIKKKLRKKSSTKPFAAPSCEAFTLRFLGVCEGNVRTTGEKNHVLLGLSGWLGKSLA